MKTLRHCSWAGILTGCLALAGLFTPGGEILLPSQSETELAKLFRVLTVYRNKDAASSITGIGTGSGPRLEKPETIS